MKKSRTFPFSFLCQRFTLKEGQSSLSSEHSKVIWTCLAEQPVHSNDREQCFRWFAEVRLALARILENTKRVQS